MKVNNVPDDVPEENTFYGVMYSMLLVNNDMVCLNDYNKSITTIFFYFILFFLQHFHAQTS